MTTSPLLTQAFRFQKTAVDNAFSIYSAIQINGKDLLENSLNQYPWMSENWKQGYLSWVSGSIQATENLKYLIDRGFQEVEKHLSESAPAAQGAAENKPTLGPKNQPAVKAAPQATASPAKKKTAPKSTAQSGGTKEEPVKKAPAARKKNAASNTRSAAEANKKKTIAPKRRAAATGTMKKTASRAGTVASKQRSSAQTAKPAAEKQMSKPAAEKQMSTDKETTVDKKTPAENKESSVALPKRTP